MGFKKINRMLKKRLTRVRLRKLVMDDSELSRELGFFLKKPMEWKKLKGMMKIKKWFLRRMQELFLLKPRRGNKRLGSYLIRFSEMVLVLIYLAKRSKTMFMEYFIKNHLITSLRYQNGDDDIDLSSYVRFQNRTLNAYRILWDGLKYRKRLKNLKKLNLTKRKKDLPSALSHAIEYLSHIQRKQAYRVHLRKQYTYNGLRKYLKQVARPAGYWRYRKKLRKRLKLCYRRKLSNRLKLSKRRKLLYSLKLSLRRKLEKRSYKRKNTLGLKYDKRPLLNLLK